MGLVSLLEEVPESSLAFSLFNNKEGLPFPPSPPTVLILLLVTTALLLNCRV